MAELGEGVETRQRAADGGKKISVRLTLFFDGTLNNRRNVALRQLATLGTREADPTYEPDVENARATVAADETLSPADRADPVAFSKRTFAAHRVKAGEDDGSYEGDFSNVARLDAYMGGATSAPDYDYCLHVYTEGIGTRDNDEDDMFGFALGAGNWYKPWVKTGIVDKVTKGIAAALSRITALKDVAKTTQISRLTIDVCGFSRGAAAARHCVHRLLHGWELANPANADAKNVVKRLADLGWHVDQFEVCAVGLFDTVVSAGVDYHGDEGGSYAEATDVLRLDAVREARAVYQLAAAEEYRLRFSLTNIDSAVGAGKGRQMFLPGAHSDVGGSYVDGKGQRKRLVEGASAPKDVKHYLEIRGWCRGHELTIDPGKFPSQQGPFGVGRTVGTLPPLFVPPVEALMLDRPPIRRTYTFIPLQLMAEFLASWKLPIVPKLRRDYNPTRDPFLKEIDTRIRSYAAEVDQQKRRSSYKDWEGSTDDQMKQLRHDYLHISFSTTGWKNKMGYQVRLVQERSTAGLTYVPRRYGFWG